MRNLFFLIFLFTTPVALAQNVDVTPEGASAENHAGSFTFHHSTLLIQGSNLTVSGLDKQVQIPQSYSYALSPGKQFFGALYIDRDLRAILIDGRGTKIGNYELPYFDPFDQTLSISMFDDGSFITRDNVANFSFFDSDGTLQYTVSNSSGSTGGEVASELAADPSGNTILLYNPRINHPESEGSRARLVSGEDEITEVYSSRDRTIKFAGITRNGSFLTLITEKEGEEDEVLIADRFGNEIESFRTGEDLTGASLSEDGGTVTIYSSNRVQVYRLEDMEALGSASTRARVNYAVYNEEDQQILALCGTPGSNKQISNPEIQVIHLEKRSIARADVDFPLSYLDLNHLTLNRTSSNQFRLEGLNRDLMIETSF